MSRPYPKVVYMPSSIKILYDAIIEGNAPSAKESSEKAVKSGMNPLEVIEKGIIPALDVVGERFGKREYFLPELLICARAAEAASRVLIAKIRESGKTYKPRGRVVIGTVRGDIHDIGKNLAATIFAVEGFEIHDLGVDVPPEKFIEKAKEVKADILALSALLSTTMGEMKPVIDALEKAGLRKKIKVLVGGAVVTEEFAKEIGADGYAKDVHSGVKKAKEWMKKV